MRTFFLGWLGGVALVLVSTRASASSCGGHVQVQNTAPPDAAVFDIAECCMGPRRDLVEAEFVPALSGGYDEDPSRVRVPVTFTDAPGLRLGRGERELEPGRWYFSGRYADSQVTWQFQVDADLESEVPEAPTLSGEEAYAGSDYSIYIEGTTDVAYVGFDVDFEGPAFAIEVYEVSNDERASEPLVSGTSSYPVLQIGDPAPECQGRIHVPTEATYDVRVAAYAGNGERGAWSDFERIEVPALPSGGCALSRAGGGANVGWVLTLGSAALVALRGRRRLATGSSRG